MAPGVRQGRQGRARGAMARFRRAGAFRRARVPAGWPPCREEDGRKGSQEVRGGAPPQGGQAVQRDGMNTLGTHAAVGSWLAAVHRAWSPPPAPRRKSPGTHRTVPLAVRHSLIIDIRGGRRRPATRSTRGRPGCPPASGTGTLDTAYTAAARHLNGMGVRLYVPRPAHPQAAGPEKRLAFRKGSRRKNLAAARADATPPLATRGACRGQERAQGGGAKGGGVVEAGRASASSHPPAAGGSSPGRHPAPPTAKSTRVLKAVRASRQDHGRRRQRRISHTNRSAGRRGQSRPPEAIPALPYAPGGNAAEPPTGPQRPPCPTWGRTAPAPYAANPGDASKAA